MRKASVTIGTWLVLGAALAVVDCGGDDSSPTGTGATGGTGGSGGATGGTGGSSGGTAGTGGSSGGMPDGGTTGGAAGAGGSAGSGGTAGAAGSAGKGGSGGAAGSAGGAGKDGGPADVGGDGEPQCPAMQPMSGAHCDFAQDCFYGSVICICRDPGPMGDWVCTGGDGGGGGADGGMCPAEVPGFGDPCPDSGSLGPCFYDSGHTECACDPATGWSCIRH